MPSEVEIINDEIEIVDITGNDRKRKRVSDVKPKPKEKKGKTENVAKIVQCAQPPREGRVCDSKCNRKACEKISHQEKLDIYYKFVKKNLKQQTEMIVKNMALEVYESKDKRTKERPHFKINQHEVCRTTFCHIYGISSSRITRILQLQTIPIRKVTQADKDNKKPQIKKKRDSTKVLNIFAKNAELEIQAITPKHIKAQPKEIIDLSSLPVGGDLDTINIFWANSMWLKYSNDVDTDIIEIEE